MTLIVIKRQAVLTANQSSGQCYGGTAGQDARYDVTWREKMAHHVLDQVLPTSDFNNISFHQRMMNNYDTEAQVYYQAEKWWHICQ